MSKSYNDAKKELEKIVNQRRRLIDSSNKLRAQPRNVNQIHFSELDDLDHQHDYRSSQRMSFTDSLNISGPLVSVPPPVNVYFRNDRDISFACPAMIPHSTRDYDLTLTPTNVSIRCTANQARLGTASTVIGTFRQLQAKARKVEVERFDALKERDILRQQVEDHSNDLKLWKRQSEQHTTEQFQAMKNATDELLSTRRALELQQLSLQESFSSRQHSNSADRAVLLSLATEKGDIGSIMHTVKSSIKALEGELSIMSNRLNRTTGQASSSSPGTQQHTHDLETKIHMTLRDVKNVEKEKYALEAQCGALRHYMELIIKINCDLTSRIESQEDLPANYRNVSQITLSAEHERMMPGAMNENTDPNTALLIDKDEDRGRSRNRSRDQSNSDVMPRDLGVPMSVFRKSSQSYALPLNSTSTSKDRMMPEGETSSDLHVTRQNNSNSTQNLGSESGIETKLNSSISMSARVRKGYVEEGGALFSWDTAYRSLSKDPIRRRARSAHPRSNIQSTVTQPDPVPSSSSSSVATVATAAVVVVRGAVREKKNGVRPVRCRGASALPTSSSKAIVTAAEASVSSGYQTHRPSRSHSPHHRPHRASASTVCNVLEGLASMGGSRASSTVRRVDFIPGGCTDGKEFNTYANSSKIAKAALYHNAALSTRVKAF